MFAAASEFVLCHVAFEIGATFRLQAVGSRGGYWHRKKCLQNWSHLNICEIIATGQSVYFNWLDCPAPRVEVSILLIPCSASTMPRSLARRYYNTPGRSAKLMRPPTPPSITGSKVAPNCNAAGPLLALTARSYRKRRADVILPEVRNASPRLMRMAISASEYWRPAEECTIEDGAPVSGFPGPMCLLVGALSPISSPPLRPSAGLRPLDHRSLFTDRPRFPGVHC
jgi:hypothetical protein